MTETMRADGRQLAATLPDIASLLGNWVNSKPETDYINRIEVSAKGDTVLIRPSSSLRDWGQAEATPYVVSGKTEVAGFHATYELGPVRTELAANEKFGILVIQSYTSFSDDRLSHYSREFFHREDAGLAGQWVNSNAATDWITGFTMSETGMLHVFGATEPKDWGTVQATTYVDNLGEPAFHAAYTFEDFSAVLAANTNKGLIIIAAFLNFNDDRKNFLCREFYFKQQGS